MAQKRVVKIKGKPVTFSSRTLKSGEVAYYRSGKRVTSSYQKRLAKGVLSGKTVTEARGHPFGKYSGKLLTRQQINEQEEFHLGQWAEPPGRGKRSRERATYYMKVRVTAASKRAAGSPTGDDEVCTPVTMELRDPQTNTQTGFTYRDLTRRFEEIALFTISKYKMELCTGNLAQDLISVWRHSRR